MLHILFLSIIPFFLFAFADDQTFQYPPSGLATMTHYSLPLNFVASCGCTGESTHYPTAAMSKLAYGSLASYGPACGRCFNLSLLNTFLSNPPFFPSSSNSVVVKITDLCTGTTWCGATEDTPNPAGYFLNFDLAFPSTAISSSFFPSDFSLYGYTDFGVWNISYESVPCEGNWEGSSNPNASGTDPSIGNGACCPVDPFVNPNTTCPSFSLHNAIPPTGTASPKAINLLISTLVFVGSLLGTLGPLLPDFTFS